MMRRLAVAGILACALGLATTPARAQCSGQAVQIRNVDPATVSIAPGDADFEAGWIAYASITLTLQAPGSPFVRLCMRSTDPNLGPSTSGTYIKPLADLQAGPPGTYVTVTQAYQQIDSQQVTNPHATFQVNVRVLLSWTADAPGEYLAHLEFATFR
jgi:hypothetical protein